MTSIYSRIRRRAAFRQLARTFERSEASSRRALPIRKTGRGIYVATPVRVIKDAVSTLTGLGLLGAGRRPGHVIDAGTGDGRVPAVVAALDPSGVVYGIAVRPSGSEPRHAPNQGSDRVVPGAAAGAGDVRRVSPWVARPSAASRTNTRAGGPSMNPGVGAAIALIVLSNNAPLTCACRWNSGVSNTASRSRRLRYRTSMTWGVCLGALRSNRLRATLAEQRHSRQTIQGPEPHEPLVSGTSGGTPRTTDHPSS